MKPARRRLLEGCFPHFRIDLPKRGALEPASLFNREMAGFSLEIGFGGGEHLVAQAEAHPSVGFLGAEPFLDGVGKLLVEIEARHLSNIRILADDARLLLRALPGCCLRRLDVLFPDPWPKARHRKRRIVNRETIVDMARVLQPMGELRLVTDIADYAYWMLDAAQSERTLAWLAKDPDGWKTAPQDHVLTRYQLKAQREGRTTTFLRFQKDLGGIGRGGGTL